MDGSTHFIEFWKYSVEKPFHKKIKSMSRGFRKITSRILTCFLPKRFKITELFVTNSHKNLVRDKKVYLNAMNAMSCLRELWKVKNNKKILSVKLGERMVRRRSKFFEFFRLWLKEVNPPNPIMF